jgi:hypothetical protein|tara:strand:- start:11 stop:385 length:375 start_codon:yes stop_codon:yes gene_type:complete
MMPNHVSNTVEVIGLQNHINSFLKHMGEGFDFEKIVPMPPSEESNWLDWSVQNWGCKWNAYDVKCDLTCDVYGEVLNPTHHVKYEFLTAWQPPRPVVARLQKDWPDLEFYGGYLCEGYEFCGSF